MLSFGLSCWCLDAQLLITLYMCRKMSLERDPQAVGLPLLDEAPEPRTRGMPDPVAERPSALKRRARQLLHEAARLAYASTRGGAQREERLSLLEQAQRLLHEREQKQKDMARAVNPPATHHTEAASGAQPGEPLEAFPRAVRRTLLVLGGRAGPGRPARPRRGREGPEG